MNAIISLCHFCEAHGPCILFCTQAFHSAHDAQLLMDSVPPDKRLPLHARPDSSLSEASMSSTTDNCEGCRSVTVDQPGFISHDSKAQISYISSQYPEQPQLYRILRHACVRSLNCEVCPGKEGPIVFGEDNSCHVLSHTFHLQDSQARGFQRLYSFIIVMMDRVFLINSWPFLVKHLRTLIDELQSKAEIVFTKEQEEAKDSQRASSSIRSAGLYSMPGPDHLRHIRTNPSGRSLVELTGDKEVFVYMHKYFVYLLKAGGMRITECMVEGPPSAMATPEISLPLTDSGTVQVGERKGVRESLDGLVSALEFQVVTMENQPLVHSLKQLYQMLGQKDFMELAYRVLRGDQVIVRGSEVMTVTSIIGVLKDLVPESCCHIVSFSQCYKESFVCNFLGLAVGVSLPKHVKDSDFHVLLDILPPLELRGADQPSHQLAATFAEHSIVGPPQTTSDLDGFLLTYKFMVSCASPSNLDQKCPLILQKLVSLLSGEFFSDALIAQALQGLKGEWMNKVKVLYKFSKMGYSDNPERVEKLEKLLKEVLLVGPEDLPILRYWRSALSKEYRSYLLHSTK